MLYNKFDFIQQMLVQPFAVRAAVFLCLLSAFPVRGENIELQPIHAGSISHRDDSGDYADSANIRVGQDDIGWTYDDAFIRAYLWFDLSVIPCGAQIEDVVLWVTKELEWDYDGGDYFIQDIAANRIEYVPGATDSWHNWSNQTLSTRWNSLHYEDEHCGISQFGRLNSEEAWGLDHFIPAMEAQTGGQFGIILWWWPPANEPLPVPPPGDWRVCESSRRAFTSDEYRIIKGWDLWNVPRTSDDDWIAHLSNVRLQVEYTPRTCEEPIVQNFPSPNDGEKAVATDGLHLRWNDPSTQETLIYNVFLDTDPGLGWTDLVYSDTMPEFHWPEKTLEPSTWYYWRVQAISCCGATIGDLWRFKTECVSRPAKPSGPRQPVYGDPSAPIGEPICWNSAPRADYYNVYFGLSPILDETDFQQDTEETCWTPPELDQGTRYYWQIEAVNDCGEEWSNVWYFETCSAPPQASDPAPPDGRFDPVASVELNPSLRWEESADYYHVAFGEADDWIWVDWVFDATEWTPDGPLKEDTDYWWRVDSYNDDCTTEGDPWVFHTCRSPGAPTILGPEQNATDVSLHPTLACNERSEVDEYCLYVGEADPPHTTVFFNCFWHCLWTLGVGSRPQLDCGKKYVWTVRHKNPCGEIRSENWYFTTVACDDAHYHPADQPPYCNCYNGQCGDGRISTCESSGYQAAWLRGDHNNTSASSRAGYLWLKGEWYHWDPDADPPNWFPGSE